MKRIFAVLAFAMAFGLAMAGPVQAACCTTPAGSCPAASLCGWNECAPQSASSCSLTPLFAISADIQRNLCIDLNAGNPRISVVNNNSNAPWQLYRQHNCGGATFGIGANAKVQDYPTNNWPAGWDDAVVAVVRKAAT